MDKGGTESSNDTDATLVDDGPSRTGLPPHVSQSPEIPSSSVLGKRPRDQRTVMDVDGPLPQSPKDKDEFAATTSRNQASPEPMTPSTSQAEASSSKLMDRDRDGDIKMQGPSQKTAPPRKRIEQNDSTMMFGKHCNMMYLSCTIIITFSPGKQHDVAECMDNCMFQIETALLKFDNMSESSDKTSVVKR